MSPWVEPTSGEIVLFVGKNREKEWTRLFHRQMPGVPIRPCHCMEDFKRRLRQFIPCLSIFIAAPRCLEELCDLAAVRPMPDNFRLVLILPDRREETARLAFTLYPRFVAYGDGDLSSTARVVEKMLAQGRVGEGSGYHGA